MPTPPNQGVGGQTAAAPTGASTTTQSALEIVAGLEGFVGDLKRELRSYGDGNTVGRDTQQLVTYFTRIHQCELQIAQAMGIDWTPNSS